MDMMNRIIAGMQGGAGGQAFLAVVFLWAIVRGNWDGCPGWRQECSDNHRCIKSAFQ